MTVPLVLMLSEGTVQQGNMTDRTHLAVRPDMFEGPGKPTRMIEALPLYSCSCVLLFAFAFHTQATKRLKSYGL